MIVAIPSHRRSNLIEKLSLSFVFNVLKINPSDVFVFISDSEDYERYVPLMNKYGFKLINANTKNVRDKFNYIHKYFNQNEDVLLIEDDVKGCVSIIDRSIKSIISNGFSTMHKHNASIWGMYPSSNKFFMQQSVTNGFAFIVANIYGFKADGDDRILVQEHSKCDYERSVLYSLYKGGVVRLNYIAPLTNNYKTKGGMQEIENRYDVEKTACDNLVKRYPKYIGYKNGSKSIYKEIKLLRNK
jgi:hypothetical protein